MRILQQVCNAERRPLSGSIKLCNMAVRRLLIVYVGMQVAPFDLLSSLEPLDLTARQVKGMTPAASQQQSSGAVQILSMATNIKR